MPELTFTVMNKVGLHARPATLFVQEAKKYPCELRLSNQQKAGVEVNAKSILGVLSLGATKGSTLVLRAEGEDAEKAIAGLSRLIENNFGEKE